MFNQNEKRPLGEEVFELSIGLNEIARQEFDNLFNANHRNKMLQKYGYTSSQTIQVKFNKLTGNAEIVN